MSQLRKATPALDGRWCFCWDFVKFLLVTSCVLGQRKPGGHLLEEVLLDAQHLLLLAKLLLLMLSLDLQLSPLL